MRREVTTKIYLEDDEINRLTFECEFICDRKKRPRYYKPGVGNIDQSYCGFHRRDMFWIRIFLGKEFLGNLCVEPDLQDPEKFEVRKNWCNIVNCLRPIIHKAKEWFLQQPEYLQQVEWTKILIENIKKDQEAGFTSEMTRLAE